MKKIISFGIILMLFAVSFFNVNVSASKATDISFSYCRSNTWKNFSGKALFSDYMDCIRIQTDPQKDYYLSYKTWNEGKEGYYSAVKSNATDTNEYAGTDGKRIRNISISVFDREGSAVTKGIVVMYRAFVDGVWLPWVSNADSEWMSYVQRKYRLDGVLDTKSGNAGINSSYISGIEIHIFEEEKIDDTKRSDEKSKLIDVPFISQIGEYPTGCESVSAVMNLNHYGFDISVDEFIDNYLDKGYPDNFNPNINFGGDPRSNNGVGCYSPVIQKAMEKLLCETQLTAKLISGLSLTEICEEYIDQGIPVIVWATSGMQKASTGKKIIYEGSKIQWITPEHCLLLVGYDKDNYIFNDPQKSEAVTYYSKIESENAYCALGCQAISIANKPFSDENFTLSKTSYIYDGKVKTPTVTVRDNQGNVLTNGTDYAVSYGAGRKNAGTYKIIVKMKGNYSGSKELSFKINPVSASSCKISLASTSYTYNGKVKTPSIVVKDSAGKTLKQNTDYTVKYATGRKNVGKYKVTVTFKGNYSGTKNLYFTINAEKASRCKASLSSISYAYNGKVKTPAVTVKNPAGKVLVKNTDYTVKYATGRKNVGKYKVTVTFKGNYSGTKNLYFTINPAKTTVKSLTAGKKSLKVAITKKSTQVTGYQIQYATNKSFKSAKNKYATSYKTTSVTIKGLSAKKTYYVRVRTYKKIGKTTYYSGWSAYKYKKTK